MTRSGFIFFSQPDDYDEPDNSEDEDFVQTKSRTINKKKKKKVGKLSRKRVKKAKQPAVLKAEEPEEKVLLTEEENTREEGEEIEEVTSSTELNGEQFHDLGDQEFCRIVELLTPCIVKKASVICQSVDVTNQLHMVLNYFRGTSLERISIDVKLPIRFIIAMLDKFLELTAETLFSDSVKSLSILTTECEVCILPHKFFVKNNESMAGLYLMIDTTTRKIRHHKLLPVYTEEYTWEEECIRIVQNHNITRDVLERMKFYFPLMRHYTFQSMDAAKHTFIFIVALWNIMLDS